MVLHPSLNKQFIHRDTFHRPFNIASITIRLEQDCKTKCLPCYQFTGAPTSYVEARYSDILSWYNDANDSECVMSVLFSDKSLVHSEALVSECSAFNVMCALSVPLSIQICNGACNLCEYQQHLHRIIHYLRHWFTPCVYFSRALIKCLEQKERCNFSSQQQQQSFLNQKHFEPADVQLATLNRLQMGIDRWMM